MLSAEAGLNHKNKGQTEVIEGSEKNRSESMTEGCKKKRLAGGTGGGGDRRAMGQISAPLGAMVSQEVSTLVSLRTIFKIL
jgi:hypothetical protein